jgi:hypothetical protein
MLRRVVYLALDRAGYLMILARLRMLDWIAGPPPETPTDRAVREEGERRHSPRSILTARRRDDTTMVSDLDIWRAAALLIRKHGSNAKLEAAKRADLMFDCGDIEGQLVWARIGRKIVELQSHPLAGRIRLQR